MSHRILLATCAALSLIGGIVTVSPASYAQATAASAGAADRAAIAQGVDAIRAPGGLVATLTILDADHAFPVVTGAGEGGGRAPIVAAANAGAGHVVVYGHGAFLSAEALKLPGNSRFLANAVRWASGGKSGAVKVGVVSNSESVEGLKAAGFAVTEIDPVALDAATLNSVDVLLFNADAVDSSSAAAASRIAAVQSWVRAGHGLITYGVGWGWQQLNPDRALPTAGFNRLLVSLAGIGCNGGTAEPTAKGGQFLCDGVGTDTLSAGAALVALESFANGGPALPTAKMGEVSRALSSALDVLPEDDNTFLPRLNALIAKKGGAGPDGAVVPSKLSPVTQAEPIARIAAVLEARKLARTPVDQIRANPAAISFPGLVPAEAPRLTQTVSVDTRVPEWHSTGLYAAPGEVITVTIPADAANKGLGVRIGAHRDSIWNLASWPRFPEITTEKRIKGTTLKIASAFGGTLYITVPERDSNAGFGVVPVTIAGAVAQPYFVKGKTTLAEWATIRQAPAPWTELQGDRVILTVPSNVVRNLRDPQALMTYWDQVADAAADLYGIPHERRRQERYCVDVEISAGYMHSGYPIMTHDDVATDFVNLRTLKGTDGQKTWGFYHELGHNHQQGDWTWDGLGEVTNNLLSLYGDETFNSVKPDYEHSHPAIAPTARHERLVAYLAHGPIPDGETHDPWLALTMFIFLRQNFGWQPFTTVFKEYQTLGPGEHPKTEMDKHDQFMVRFSKAIGKNLGPYFTAWGLTTSPAARQSIADLPTWMPADWPTPAELAAERAHPSNPNNYGY